MIQHGDVRPGATLSMRFSTQDASGALVTLAGGTVRARKGTAAGSTSTAGLTLTTDVVTGQHCVDVDTSADAFYASGADFVVELTAGTVSGVSLVGLVVGHFSIAHRAVAVDSTGKVSIASGGIGAGAHAAAELNAIADAFLDRNMATGTDSGTDSTVVRTVRQALRRLRNKEAIVAGVGTVYKENDTTASFTYATTAAAGNPLTAVDPT